MTEIAAPSRGAWLTQPSVGFVRDVRGSAWIDHLFERTKGGRPKRVRASRMSGYAHQVLGSFATDLREERFLTLGLCRMSRLELDMVSSFDPDSPKAMASVDEAIVAAKQAAGLWWQADRGTWLHSILEFDDRGVEPPAELLAERELYRIDMELLDRLRANWRAMRARYGLAVVAIEQTVVADAFNAAGTLDRLVELQRTIEIGPVTIPMGAVVVLDVKTSSLWLADGTPSYWHGYTSQCYLYADSVPYIVGESRPDRRLDWPFDISVEHALIGHVNLNPLDGPLGQCRIWHADLLAGRELALLAQRARQFEARRDLFIPAAT
jgi:hypothetical protein